MPFGILDVNASQLSIYFGQSAETSDFIVDCLIEWWQKQRSHYPDIHTLAIDLDGGSAVRSGSVQKSCPNGTCRLSLSSRYIIYLRVPKLPAVRSPYER